MYASSGESRKGHISGVTFDVKEIEFAVVDGLAVFEGDVVLGTIDEIDAAEEAGAAAADASDDQADLPPNPRPGSSARGCIIVGSSRRWHGGVIPYTVHEDFKYGSRVEAAIEHWRRNTSLTFVARDKRKHRDYIQFRNGDDMCSSYVGRKGKMQEIKLASGCGTGAAIHEIGHAVGLWHEQSREDRDRFVTVNMANIETEKKHNFNQHITDGDDVGAYDYESVMHYSRGAFAKKAGVDTITPPRGIDIGQRLGLSNGDVAAVDRMYGTGPGNFHVNQLWDTGVIGQRVERRSWSKGWTQAVPYAVDGKMFLFMLKERGSGHDGNNVHIHRINGDGGIGKSVAERSWNQGWSTAVFLELASGTYLYLMRREGMGSDGTNVHIHRMDSDGDVGRLVETHKWSEGWWRASLFGAGGKPYLFVLCDRDGDSDGNDVMIYRVNSDGTLGKRVAAHNWTRGWSTATFYRVGGETYLFLLKRKTKSGSGRNVHVHRMNQDGTVGPCVDRRLWGEGWSHAEWYTMNGSHFMLLYKEIGTGSDGNNVHIHRINSNGTIGRMVRGLRVLSGYTTVVSYVSNGRTFLLQANANAGD